MTRKLTALSIATIACLGLGVSLAAAGERCAAGCIEFTPEAELTGSQTLDAGGYSSTTQEHLAQSAAYFVAHVELPDGRAHPAYGANPHGVYVFKTMDGRYVVRIFEIPLTEFAASVSN